MERLQSTTSAPNQLPPDEAVGPSVRGFVLCIAAPSIYPTPPTISPRNDVLIIVDKSEQTNRLAHRGLDVQRFDVLPVLLQQGDEEVDAYYGVG